MKMELIPVDVDVGRDVRSFIVACTGSATFVPPRYSNLWCLVKQQLMLRPKEPAPSSPDPAGTVTILLQQSGEKTYNARSKVALRIDPLYRCYLDPTGQAVIRRYFANQMKISFRMYMLGATTMKPEVKIPYAITEFLLEYNVDVTPQLLSRLQKDWFRFRKANDNGVVNPIVT